MHGTLSIFLAMYLQCTSPVYWSLPPVNVPLHGAHPLLELGKAIIHEQSLFLGGILNDLQVPEEDLSQQG